MHTDTDTDRLPQMLLLRPGNKMLLRKKINKYRSDDAAQGLLKLFGIVSMQVVNGSGTEY